MRTQKLIACWLGALFATPSMAVTYCYISSGSALAFGAYDPTSSTPADAPATVQVTCTPAATTTLSISVGNGTGASYANRVMTYGSAHLNYNIYADSTRKIVLGDGTGVSSTLASPSGTTYTFTAYGRIPANQTTAIAGFYTDTVIVTITY